ncbi:GntR family transcriptional regulator [Planomonospora algeriensis]
MITELDPTRPKWKQIYEIVMDRIEDGTYPVNGLISEVALTEEFGVARETVRKVTRKLREEGRVRTEHGMGSFVNSPQDSEERGETE